MLESTHQKLAVDEAHGCLYLTVTSKFLTYSMLDELTRIVNIARSESNIRAIALEAAVKDDNAGELGDMPESMQHRAPAGSHGPPPIVEQKFIETLRNFFPNPRCLSYATRYWVLPSISRVPAIYVSRMKA